MHLHCAVTVAGDELVVDFNGTDTRDEIQAWSTYGNTRGYVIAQLASMVDAAIPKNEGFFDNVTLIVPEGCVLNPRPPKAVSAGSHHPGTEVGEVVALALAQAMPDKSVPQIYKLGVPIIVSGLDKDGQRFIDHGGEVYAGWIMAAKGQDGWGSKNAAFGNLYKAPAELHEPTFPHLLWDRDYQIDTGGPGQWRGGCGSHYVKETLVPARVHTYVMGAKYPMPGIAGGKPGSPNRLTLKVGSGEEIVVDFTAEWVEHEAGDRIVYEFGGGGGWGDPLDRDPQAVLDDVLDEYVSSRARAVTTASCSPDRSTTSPSRSMSPRPGARAGDPVGRVSGYRVGIDVGGTFTDLICVTPEGEVVLDKTPTTPDDQSTGVMNGLGQLAERFGLDAGDFARQLDILVHGTTTADNTMIEETGAPTGLLTTEGHRDEIEMRRGYKENIWDPAAPPPFAIARRRARIAIPERVGPDGAVVLALDEDAVRAGVRRLKQLGVTSIAICFLYSYLNADHEQRAREILLDEYPDVDHVSVSHEVLPKASEFERVSTTLVNAYVAPKLARYLARLADALRTAGYGGQLVIMQSTGGVMTSDYVASRAVTLLGSGPGRRRARGSPRRHTPPASATSSRSTWAARRTTWVSCATANPRSRRSGTGDTATTSTFRWSTSPQSVPAAARSPRFRRVRCSSARRAPARSRGPRATAAAAPARRSPTPTSCSATSRPTGFAGGRMTLDVEAARAAVERDVAGPLGIDVTTAAWGVVRTVNATMADAVRRVLATKGVDPRELALVAFGGNGPVHAWAQAEELGIDRVLVPRTAPGFSALGCWSPTTSSTCPAPTCPPWRKPTRCASAACSTSWRTRQRRSWHRPVWTAAGCRSSATRACATPGRTSTCRCRCPPVMFTSTGWPRPSTTCTRATAVMHSAPSARSCASCASSRPAAPTSRRSRRASVTPQPIKRSRAHARRTSATGSSRQRCTTGRHSRPVRASTAPRSSRSRSPSSSSARASRLRSTSKAPTSSSERPPRMTDEILVNNGKRLMTLDELARTTPGMDRLMVEIGYRAALPLPRGEGRQLAAGRATSAARSASISTTRRSCVRSTPRRWRSSWASTTRRFARPSGMRTGSPSTRPGRISSSGSTTGTTSSARTTSSGRHRSSRRRTSTSPHARTPARAQGGLGRGLVNARAVLTRAAVGWPHASRRGQPRCHPDQGLRSAARVLPRRLRRHRVR